MLREDFGGDCKGCAPWCNEECREMGPYPDRFSLVGGAVVGNQPPRLLYAPFSGDELLADSDRIIVEDDYARQNLASEEKLLTQCGNWNLVFKARPYGVKDFMVIIDLTGGSPVVGIEDLANQDLIDLLALIECLRGNLKEQYPESEFVFGLNKGKNQSLKRIHLHVTDVSEAIEPAEESVRAHVRARVSSMRRPYKATREIVGLVKRIVPEAYLDNSTIRIPLFVDDDRDVEMLKTLGTRFSEVLAYLDEESGNGEQWCYSMLFDEDDEGEFVRVAFFDRPVGTTDIAGVGVDWYNGAPTQDFLDERQRFKGVVQMAVTELDEE
ncbi:hypothetical protein HN709_05075 [Candidatus Peregrinibacteria bacterium]|jgi:diadenosine tetraphosphate (Ap4A) HIT family hydrolase|nr:hypothetical protein [Candidatus Peregrinibacteria bacterium]MBT7737034.1 hypothetical protein [Candidatus Peregrinibacteria bacterium]